MTPRGLLAIHGSREKTFLLGKSLFFLEEVLPIALKSHPALKISQILNLHLNYLYWYLTGCDGTGTYFSTMANPWIVYSNCPCKALYLVFCPFFLHFISYTWRDWLNSSFLRVSLPVYCGVLYLASHLKLNLLCLIFHCSGFFTQLQTLLLPTFRESDILSQDKMILDCLLFY